LSKPKTWLVLANMLLVFFLILFNNLGIVPLRTGDFIFFSILFLAFALYRPGWAFLFFIGTIMLENINLAPGILKISIRPYQFIGVFLILAIIVRIIFKKWNYGFFKLKFPDYLVVIIAIAGFISAFIGTSRGLSIRLSIIFLSFAFLYFLTRNYLQNITDIKKIIPFFLGSSLVVIFYGIWQNVRFIYGGNNFETMPGRINGTFIEPDWMGMSVILVISVLYSVFYLLQKRFSSENVQIKKYSILYLFLIFSFIALILTVSRSAWLGGLAATVIFLFIAFTNAKLFFKNLVLIFSAGIISIIIVYTFHLTNFQLLNRVQSTGSGMQKITIACAKNINLRSVPTEINDISELEKFNCRHINLEEIEKEKALGNKISEIYRKDPNVNIRREIYKKSWEQIKNHPLNGIGWGSIGEILGKDERGNYFNSSNIFLETYLGTGIFGFISLVILFGYILFKTTKDFYFSQDNEIKVFNLFVIISWFGIIIANLFNAGIFLGFLWIWMAIAQIENNK
jgi:hypothetical protein